MNLPTILDTNVLLRALLDDVPDEGVAAATLFARETSVVVTPTALCELVWVLRRVFRRSRPDVLEVLRRLLDNPSVITDRDAAAAGLAAYEAGADFADGVILHQGRRLGGARMATFDRRAAARIEGAYLLD